LQGGQWTSGQPGREHLGRSAFGRLLFLLAWAPLFALTGAQAQIFVLPEQPDPYAGIDTEGLFDAEQSTGGEIGTSPGEGSVLETQPETPLASPTPAEDPQTLADLEPYTNQGELFIFVEETVSLEGQGPTLAPTASGSLPEVSAIELRPLYSLSAVDQTDGAMINPPEAYAGVTNIKIPEFCALSDFAAATEILQRNLVADAWARQRLLLAAFAPCDELLVLAPQQVFTTSMLIRVEVRLFGAASARDGQSLIADAQADLAQNQALSAQTVRGLTQSLSALPFASRRAVIQNTTADFTYFELDQVQLEAAGNEPLFDLKLVSFVGLLARDEGALIVTVNAGADGTVTLAQVFESFEAALAETSLQFFGQN